MTRPFNPIARSLRRLRAGLRCGPRPRRARGRGSVLVLVVALLVLLALVGTAYLTTTRVDRYAARQYDSAVRLDLLLKGWMNTVRSVVIDDLFDQNDDFRPSTNAQDPRGDRAYENFDSFHVTRNSISGLATPVRHGDEWLAARAAWLDDPYRPADSTAAAPNYPIWPAIGGPLLESRFDTPYIDQSNASLTTANITRLDDVFALRDNAIITSIDLPQDGAGTVSFPALRVVDPRTGRRATVVAGDADGDGIADSMLERLAELNGITYYAGYRIVDHGSAINVNTAQSNTFDFLGEGTLSSDNQVLRDSGYLHVSGFFPSHVGLYEMLPSFTAPTGSSRMDNLSTELNEVNNWRYGFDWTSGGGGVRAQGVDLNPSPGETPLAETTYGTFVRNDFRFTSVGESLWMNLGRRLENPAPNLGPPVTGAATSYRAFDIATTAALAYRGSAVLNPTASKTELEARMVQATETGAAAAVTRVRSRPFLADSADRWFMLNYSFDRESPYGDPAAEQWIHRRALLTASNANSSAAPSNRAGTVEFALPGAIARYAGTFTVDPATGTPIAANNRHEIDRTADPSLPVPLGTLNDVRSRPAAKADLNNATFGELWRAFWQVMSEPEIPAIDPVTQLPVIGAFTGRGDHAGTPFTDYINRDRRARGNADDFDPYTGSRFTYLPGLPPVGTPPVIPPNRAATEFPAEPSNFWANRYPAVGWNPARMFRSPLRGVPETGAAAAFTPSTFRMPADQVLLLRSAIAATNLEQLRRRDDNLAVRTIVGYPVGAGSGAEPLGNSLMVYGRPRTGGAATVNDPAQPVTARIFGVGRQPFLTEIFAHSDTLTVYGGIGPNPQGYMAIEFYNPYPVPIDLRYARIFRVNRQSTGPYNAPPPGTPPGLVVEDMSDPTLPATARIVLDPADPNGPVENVTGDPYGVSAGTPQLIVPPHGWLVMENYNAPGLQPTPAPAAATVAAARPSSNNLDGLTAGAGGQGAINPAFMPRANFVYVPNLHLLFNHEFVLARWPTATTVAVTWTQTDYLGAASTVRTMDGVQYDPAPAAVRQPGNPANPGGGTPAVYGPPTVRDFAPLDSYDFTGIGPAGTAGFAGVATAWHYHRPNAADKMWRFVYPGRYDGSQPWQGSPTVPLGEPAFPRQQGTKQFPAPVLIPQPPDEDPWTPAAAGTNPGINLGHDGTLPPLGANAVAGRIDASYAWSDGLAYKGEFTIPLRSLALTQTWPGVNPPTNIGVGSNKFPYGGFARLLDVLQVPFVGSYWIQHNEDWFSNVVADTNRMIEVNPISMDAAMAEDTDTADDPTVERLGEAVDASTTPGGNDAAQSGDTRFNSREQLGRFAPLRPSLVNGDGLDNNANYPATVTPQYRIGTSNFPRYGDYFDAASDRDAWRYQWAKRVAEHFTVQSPEDDTHGQGSAQAYWPAPTSAGPGGLHPLQSVANTASTGGQTKASYARVWTNVAASNAATQTMEVTAVPTWVRAGAYITFLGMDGNPSVSAALPTLPRASHYGQRCQVTGVTFLAGNPPRARITFRTDAANDPAPWDATQPIPAGTLVKVEGRVEGPGGVEGQVNINTAPARVLAALPWFPPEIVGGTPRPISIGRVTWDKTNKVLLPSNGSDTVDDNWELAQAIAWWRDRFDGTPPTGGQPAAPGGPFTSIFDLYKIPAFRVAQAQILNTGLPGGIAPIAFMPTDPVAPNRDIGLYDGDFTFERLYNGLPGVPPLPPGTGRETYTDGIRFDFKEQYLLLNRVSNLITTRSDLFTVYVVIQGWRDVGLLNKPPQFVAERRDALIVDRNAITPNNRKMRELKVATD